MEGGGRRLRCDAIEGSSQLAQRDRVGVVAVAVRFVLGAVSIEEDRSSGRVRPRAALALDGRILRSIGRAPSSAAEECVEEAGPVAAFLVAAVVSEDWDLDLISAQDDRCVDERCLLVLVFVAEQSAHLLERHAGRLGVHEKDEHERAGAEEGVPARDGVSGVEKP